MQISAGCRGNGGHAEARGQERREDSSVGDRVFSQQLSAGTVPLAQTGQAYIMYNMFVIKTIHPEMLPLGKEKINLKKQKHCIKVPKCLGVQY